MIQIYIYRFAIDNNHQGGFNFNSNFLNKSHKNIYTVHGLMELIYPNEI